MAKNRVLAVALALSAMTTAVEAAPIQVFYTDFNGALPAEIAPGTATLTGVQGYNGYGPTGNQFNGNFLRSAKCFEALDRKTVDLEARSGHVSLQSGDQVPS